MEAEGFKAASRERILPRKAYPAGRVLFRQGDPGDAAYIIESGSLSITRTDPSGTLVDLGLRGAGALIGEMAVFDGAPRMATATVADPAVLVRIPADQMRAKLAEADPFLLAVVRILMDHPRAANRHYARRREPASLHEHLSVMRSVLQSLREMESAALAGGPDMPTKIGQCVAILAEVTQAMERRADRHRDGEKDGDGAS